MCRPRSDSSQARASASWTASSAAGKLPYTSASPFTRRAYSVPRNALTSASFSATPLSFRSP